MGGRFDVSFSLMRMQLCESTVPERHLRELGMLEHSATARLMGDAFGAATSPLISVEEYLKTAYRPDCDYVDGVVEERNLGEFDHGLIQAKLIAFFMGQAVARGILSIPEWRFQITPTGSAFQM